MTNGNEPYPDPETGGTQPRLPEEGIPSDPIVGTQMGGDREEAEERRHGTVDTGRSGTDASSPTAEDIGTPPTEGRSR